MLDWQIRKTPEIGIGWQSYSYSGGGGARPSGDKRFPARSRSPPDRKGKKECIFSRDKGNKMIDDCLEIHERNVRPVSFHTLSVLCTRKEKLKKIYLVSWLPSL